MKILQLLNSFTRIITGPHLNWPQCFCRCCCHHGITPTNNPFPEATLCRTTCRAEGQKYSIVVSVFVFYLFSEPCLHYCTLVCRADRNGWSRFAFMSFLGFAMMLKSCGSKIPWWQLQGMIFIAILYKIKTWEGNCSCFFLSFVTFFLSLLT